MSSHRFPIHKAANSPVQRVRGFSLVELMIVIAIIGILAAVAIPSYSKYVEKTRRADGQFSLMMEVQALERCKAANYSYVGCLVSSKTSPESHYEVALSGVSTNDYVLRATGVGVQANDPECKVMEINARGIRTPDPDTSDCWPG